MGIRQQKQKRFEGLLWKSGNFYTFKYRAWANDPKPTIIFMYAYSGYHPNTGRQWRFFQAINFSYIPRNVRKRFMKDYLKARERARGDINFVWDDVKRKYPWLKIAIRRYFYSPGSYIISPKEVPFEEAEDVIVSTWAKDFSKKTITAIRSKFRKRKTKSKKDRRREVMRQAHRDRKVISEKRYKQPRHWTHKDTDKQHGL